jgi:hypothetical protein
MDGAASSRRSSSSGPHSAVLCGCAWLHTREAGLARRRTCVLAEWRRGGGDARSCADGAASCSRGGGVARSHARGAMACSCADGMVACSCGDGVTRSHVRAAAAFLRARVAESQPRALTALLLTAMMASTGTGSRAALVSSEEATGEEHGRRASSV